MKLTSIILAALIATPLFAEDKAPTISPKEFVAPIPDEHHEESDGCFKDGLTYFIWPSKPLPKKLPLGPAFLGELDFAANPDGNATPFVVRIVSGPKEPDNNLQKQTLIADGFHEKDGKSLWRIFVVEPRFHTGTRRFEISLIPLNERNAENPKTISNVLVVDVEFGAP